MALKQLEKPTERPDQKSYDDTFADIVSGNREDGYNPVYDLSQKESEASSDSLSDTNEGQGESAARQLSNQESRPVNTGNWTTNIATQAIKTATKSIAKRPNRAIPIVFIVSAIAFILTGGMLSLQSLPINLMNNIFNSTDMIGPGTSARQQKVLSFMMGDSDVSSTGICSSIKMKCKKGGRISNKALSKMASSGIVAAWGTGDGRTVFNTETMGKKGYPDTNPTHYDIIDDSGKRVATVAAKDFDGFMSQQQNETYARKVFGVRGAFNMKVNMLAGKYINKNLFSKLKLSRTGGIASGLKEKVDPTKILTELKLKIPGMTALDTHLARINAKHADKLGKISKTQTAYMAAAISCLVLTIPGSVIGSYASMGIERGAPLAQDTLYSPAAKFQSDIEHNNTTEADLETTGSLLTAQSVMEDGTMKAAIDSPSLQYAAGYSTTKPPVSKYAPGYAAVNDPLLSTGRIAEIASSDGCAAIMSPAAIAAAIAADGVYKVIAAGTGIGLLAAYGIDMLADKASDVAIQEGTKYVVTASVENLMKNDGFDQAISQPGYEYGEALAPYAMGIPAMANAATNLSVMDVDQWAAATQIKQDYEIAERKDDIASLSPFDTSSQYTFLGSLLYQAQNTAITSGFYANKNAASLLTTMSSIVSSAVTGNYTASAASENQKCDFADQWKYPLTSDGKKLAVLANGMPCTGPIGAFNTMGSDEAIQTLSDAGYFNEDIDFTDEATISELLSVEDSSGNITENYIRADTPLWFKATNCSDFTSGDYFTNAVSCITQGSENLSAKTAEAIAVFLFDFLMIQSINGEDDHDPAATSTLSQSRSGGSVSIVDPSQWAVDKNHSGAINKKSAEWQQWVNLMGGNGNVSSSALAPIPDVGYEICSSSNSLNSNGGGNKYNPNAAASAAALIKAFNEAFPSDKRLTPGACTRSLEAQQKAYANYKAGGNLAATPGTSNHGWGLAIDFRTGTSSITSFTSPEYLWLKNNSYQYGWINPLAMTPAGGCSGNKCEAWHFQYVGPLIGGASSL